MKRLVSVLLIGLFFLASPVFATSVAKMDKEELKGLLGSDKLVILDVRTGRDWSTSEFKIKDSVRIDGKAELAAAADNYPKENTYVLYCA